MAASRIWRATMSSSSPSGMSAGTVIGPLPPLAPPPTALLALGALFAGRIARRPLAVAGSGRLEAAFALLFAAGARFALAAVTGFLAVRVLVVGSCARAGGSGRFPFLRDVRLRRTHG